MQKKAGNASPKLRELFIEELAEVRGGSDEDPLGKVKRAIRELLLTTHACGEEGPPC